MKEFLKSVKIWQSYCPKFGGFLFCGTQCSKLLQHWLLNIPEHDVNSPHWLSPTDFTSHVYQCPAGSIGRTVIRQPQWRVWLVWVTIFNFGPELPLLFKLHKFGQLILRKTIEIVATRCQILWLKCTKFDFGRDQSPLGELTVPPLPDSLAGFKGATSKGMGRQRWEE